MAALVVGQMNIATGLLDNMVAAAGGGDTFVNDGKTYFEVNNGGGAPVTVTFVTPATVQGVAIADPALSVVNATRRKFGPFPTEIFNDANNNVAVTYSGVTTVTVQAFKG